MGLLRVTLAFAVLLSHLPPATFHFISGGLAVQGFFIVSGFYMSLVLDSKYRDTGLFYTNRLLRLLPAYVVMMAIAAVTLFALNASATASPDVFRRTFANPISALFLGVENLILVGQDLLYWFRIDPTGALNFDPTGAPPTDASPVAWQALLVPQSWSLSLELMFYACAPFLARLNWKWLAAFAVASAALRLYGLGMPASTYALWQGRFFPTVLFLFLLGMLAHRALPLAMKAPRWTGYAIAAALLALLVFAPMLNLPPEPTRWTIYLAIAVAIPFIFASFRNHAWDRWIGDLSYPIYLSHLVIIGLVLTFNAPQPVLVAIGGTLALSFALLMLVDRPVDRWRQRRAARQQSKRKPEHAEALHPLVGVD